MQRSPCSCMRLPTAVVPSSIGLPLFWRTSGAAGHKQCCSAYDTARYDGVECSPLAEQQNKRLRQLENHLSYMRQARALWYLRYFVCLMNEREEDKAAGRCM